MEDTLADESDKIIPNRARWYTVVANGSYRNTPYEDLSYKWAGGGFLSTAEDLARFGSALLKPGFLKQDTLAMIFARQKQVMARPRSTDSAGLFTTLATEQSGNSSIAVG